MFWILLFYLLGCIVAFGRITADNYECFEEHINTTKPPIKYPIQDWRWILCLGSWIFAMTTLLEDYIIEKPKYLFKWTFRKLNNYDRA
jgi:hypothetical protein